MNKGNSFYYEKVKNYLDECYFDIASTPSNAYGFVLDEAKLARMITKIVISSATLVTTSLSLKQYAKDLILTYRKVKL